MKNHISLHLFVFALSFWLTSLSHAQPATPVDESSWELNLHGAGLRTGLFEDGGQALQVGGRIARNFANGLSFGGNVDWATVSDVTLAPFAGLNASLLLYSAEIGYRFPASTRTTFFLNGGAGAATLTIDEPPPRITASSTGLLIPFGAGIKIHNRPTDPSWALRFDVRDNVILLETGQDPEGQAETEPRHNIEVSGGFSFLFGGGESASTRDTDRDGVVDSSDWCLNRPGTPVDDRGCPLDRDEDGVPNERDQCIETPAGLLVDDRGCPLDAETPAEPGRDEIPARGEPEDETPVRREPEPAPVPAEPAPSPAIDSDQDGVADERDLCPGTPSGIRVDDRGCLARPDLLPPAPAPDAEARPVVPPESLACLDNRSWFVAKREIEFENRRFELVGSPATVDARYLIRAGTYDGVPMFASVSDQTPYTSLWLPRCGNEGLYELYIESGTLP